MKKLIAIVMMMLPMIAWGQKIAKHEVDKFTKQVVIETSSEKIADYNKWKSLLPDPSEVFGHKPNSRCMDFGKSVKFAS